jgi:hypothetical protein
VFLTLTAAPIAMELLAALDSSPDTVPWTQLISTWVPWPVALGAYVALAVWLPVHFWVHYRRRPPG